MSKEIETKEATKSNKKYIVLALVVILVAIGIMVNNGSKETIVSQTTVVEEKQTSSVEKVSAAKESTIARIDISTPLIKANEPQFEVYVDESNESLKNQADWMPKYNIQGYVVHKEGNMVNIIIKTHKDIDLKFSLRGIWDAEDNGQLIVHNVTYTMATINNESILEQPQTVWFAKPFAYEFKAKAGEEYKIHVEWTKVDDIPEE